MRTLLAFLCAGIALSVAAPALAADARTDSKRPREAVREQLRDARASSSPRRAAASGDVGTSTATASTVLRVDDGTGDLDVSDDAGDVTAATVDLRNGHVVRLGFTTARFAELTDVTWDDEASFAVWYLETTGDDLDDYEVFAATVGGRPAAEVYDLVHDRVACVAEFLGAAASGYRVDLPASCLGDPEQVRFSLYLDYDPDPVEMAVPLSLDLVPDEDYWSAAATRGPRPRPHAQPAVRRGARWYLRDDLGAGRTDVRLDYGYASDVPLLCDWDGDGSRTLGVFRSGTWWLRNSNSLGGSIRSGYGQVGDVPVCGDWDGDGDETPGVYRAGRWYLRPHLTGGRSTTFTYGLPGDVPVVGDWDGDGRDSVGVWRRGTWYLRNAARSGTAHRFGWGLLGDVPVAGDWDGDGRDTPGVYRDGEWLVRNTLTSGRVAWAWSYGLPGDTPLVWE